MILSPEEVGTERLFAAKMEPPAVFLSFDGDERMYDVLFQLIEYISLVLAMADPEAGIYEVGIGPFPHDLLAFEPFRRIFLDFCWNAGWSAVEFKRREVDYIVLKK